MTVLQERPEKLSTAPTKRPRFEADWALGMLGVLVALLAWEAASRSGLLARQFIPPASEVLAELVGLLGTADFWTNIWFTLESVLLGLLVVMVLGPVLALLIGLVPAFRESTWFLLEFLKPIPPIVLIPLGLLLWGPVLEMKVILIAFGALWPLLTQLVYGIQETDRTLWDLSRSYRLGWQVTTRFIVAPSMLPYALTGLRISASIAVVVAVVTELVGGAAGIGQAIAVAQVNNLLPALYAYVLTAGVLGIAINLVFMALERPLLFWHASIRERNG
jgi:ABC-type nitrate/sulfonate/bicarbonate transport system permease component